MAYYRNKKSESQGDSLLDQIAGQLMANQAANSDLNIIEFIESVCDSFDLTLFLAQRVILKAIYGLEMDAEESIILEKWRSEKKTNWKSKKELLEDINKTRKLKGYEPYELDKWEFNYQNITLQAGMRSSKSSLVGLIVAYEFFKLITHANPQRFLGVPSSSMIYITVLASTERQTQGTIYGYVKNYIEGSTYFKGLISAGRILVKENEIEFPEKNIRIAAGHSRATSIVGRSAVLVAFDELAMFSNDDGHTSNAGEVYSRVGRAAATFGSKSKRIAMSSVKCEGDYMEELVRDTWDKQISQKALVFDLTTFDINPIMTMDNPIIASDYEKDIVTAQRDYENIRPGAISGFLNPMVVDAATMEVVKDPSTGIESLQKRDPMKYCVYRPFEMERINPITGDMKIMSAIELALVQPIDFQYESYIHLDPGFVNDSYGLVCGHGELTPDGIATVIDIVLEWVPKQLGKGQVAKVDVPNVEDAVIQLAAKRNVSRVTFDHFQNESSIQNLWQKGIDARTQHFGAGIQKKIYDLLRLRMNAGLVRIPAHPSLMEELKNLVVTAGERVDHPKSKDSTIPGKGKISKDLADCLAMVNYIIAMQEKSFIRGDENNHLGSSFSISQGNALAITSDMLNKNKINWKFS